jgi:hypothetical protein
MKVAIYAGSLSVHCPVPWDSEGCCGQEKQGPGLRRTPSVVRVRNDYAITGPACNDAQIDRDAFVG